MKKDTTSRLNLAVLEAAYRFYLRGVPTVSVCDLTVRAWKIDRQAIGLWGYKESYPDHNRVVCCLSGKRGLVAKGLLERTKALRYTITPAGLDVVRRHLSRSINESTLPSPQEASHAE